MAVRARGLADRVVGIGRNPAKLDEARDLGAIDEGTTDPVAGAWGADVVVVCTPVSRIAADCRTIAASAPDKALLTDAGSTKASIVRAVESDPRAAALFCGAHPIAGSERQGVKHARGDLFVGRTCVVTPGEKTPESRLRANRAFWGGLGCRVVEMGAEAHDASLALTSHLPHALASALAAIVPEKLHPLAAGAFRDVTRIASSDPGLWSAIFLANRDATLASLSLFDDRLATFRAILKDGDAEALEAWWGEGKAARDGYGSSSAPGDLLARGES